MKKLAAFYQCYKQRKSLNYVLKKFREVYPAERCFLVCDGGFDYTEESKKYNCNYRHLGKIETNKNLTFNTRDACKEYINRLFETIKELEEDYVIILEDDVAVFSAIDLDGLNAQINGCNKNEFLNANIENFLKMKGISCPSPYGFYYGACGGSILDVKFFKETLRHKDRIGEIVDLYCDLSPRETWASDTILSFTCYAFGGNIQQYEGYCETWYPDYIKRLNEGKVKVLHQYKVLYE